MGARVEIPALLPLPRTSSSSSLTTISQTLTPSNRPPPPQTPNTVGLSPLPPPFYYSLSLFSRLSTLNHHHHLLFLGNRAQRHPKHGVFVLHCFVSSSAGQPHRSPFVVVLLTVAASRLSFIGNS
ncbi:hypothetical protein PIB30_021947 [Stylosanthes scabra]|uniref:Uncharacterized protein n=1 Tax=Stylosanthes scabra TaxID=79078 RepID=A0ABU6U865_9FABA|nr:hypothetical protein [Stylosanthes scabra]